MNLKTPIKELDRTYKMYASRLLKLEIETIEDLLFHIPFRYEDFSLISEIGRTQPGEIVTIKGQIAEMKNAFTKNYKKIQKAVIADDSGKIEVVWFNQPYLLNVLKPQTLISISGKIAWFGHTKVIEPTEYEVLQSLEQETIHTGRLVPVYNETKGVSSKWMRRKIYNILKTSKGNLSEHLPQNVQDEMSLVSFENALKDIHFPKHLEDTELARKRLAFDELFLLQISAIKRRSEWQNKLKGHSFSVSEFSENIQKFWDSLPFELTNAQKKVVQDIFKDLESSVPMNRLLEGDVGSGKTVVSAIAMYLAHLNGFQSVLMAPTEILAGQHFKTISELLSPLNVKIDLRTGSSKYHVLSIKDKKKNIHTTKYMLQDTNILVGTHALLSEKIEFSKLGLVVIDEQQRFGVEQRAIIRSKGENPHLLTMTATPIPRTIALTMYGDLDLSVLDEMPKGRKIIKTWLTPEEKRKSGYEWIEKQVKEGDQVFIICPFIEESESMSTVKAASKEFERLQKHIFPKLNLGLLHGKQKGKEKDAILSDFKNKKFDILVATPVVEVGIDIPNATIIVIEAAERFGLSQLHQLRGRVGRGDKQSYCLLFSESPNFQTQQRLKAMENSQSGFELAELDLKLRGPGDMFGTSQHGLKSLKIANFSDTNLIEKAKSFAEKVFPEISKYPNLIEKIEEKTNKNISPD